MALTLFLILVGVLVILTQGKNIMSKIGDFAAAVAAHNEKIDAAVTGLTADVADLKGQIEALQASSGTVTPEDQALLDAIEGKLAAVADKLAALDDTTTQAPNAPTP